MTVLTGLVSDGLLIYREGGRAKLREEARCRMCRRPASVRDLTRHHLVPKGWRGWERFGYGFRIRDCDANVVPLCDPCHRDVEEYLWARSMLRKMLGGAEVAFVAQVRGLRWFDGCYPPVAVRPRR